MTRASAERLRRVAIVTTFILSAAAWSTELFKVDVRNSGLMWLVLVGIPILTIAFWTAMCLTIKLRNPVWPEKTING